MLELTIESVFSAAHRIDGYDGVCKDTHGHNFVVEVTVNVKKLNKIGFGIDFLDLKTEVTSLLKQLDHKDLNKIKYFKEINPTSENIAIWLHEKLSKQINSKYVKISKVKIKESSEFSATYYGK